MPKIDNDEFKFNDEKVKDIANTFALSDTKNVYTIYKVFNRIKADVKHQYLAHAIRTMETAVQNQTGNPFFKIIIKPLDVSHDNLAATAYYQKHSFFSIGYPEHLDDIQKRILIAHELGHLYLIELLNNTEESLNLTEKNSMEPLSTIFGLMIIMDKNDFYSFVAQKKLLHSNWRNLLEDFKQLFNRNKDIYNIS